MLYASRFPTAILYRKVRGYTDHLYGPSLSRKNDGEEHREQTPVPLREPQSTPLQTGDSSSLARLKNFQNRGFAPREFAETGQRRELGNTREITPMVSQMASSKGLRRGGRGCKHGELPFFPCSSRRIPSELGVAGYLSFDSFEIG